LINTHPQAPWQQDASEYQPTQENDMLCKGFSTTRVDTLNQVILETLYALLEDGTVLVTNEHKRTNEFGAKGRRWFVGEKPDNAEFIGNYPVPSTRI